MMTRKKLHLARSVRRLVARIEAVEGKVRGTTPKQRKLLAALDQAWMSLVNWKN
jgi:hypothetical protein